MKKAFVLVLVAVMTFGAAGCSKPADPTSDTAVAATHEQSEEEKAQEVVRSYVTAQAITYKSPETYRSGDKFLVPALAEMMNKKREPLYSMTTEHKAFITITNTEVEYLEKRGEGKHLLVANYDEVQASDESEELKKGFKNARTTLYFVLAKQQDGSLLIEEITKERP